MGRYLVTAALPYSNGRLHVGHIAGAYLPADIFVRYMRARGHEVRFICGSDDNGVAIPITAMREGTTPQEVCTRYNRRQAADFDGLGIRFDIYGGTHQPDCLDLHNRLSQEFFLRIHEKGYFTKRRTTQLYDVQAGRFLPDRYVMGTCPECGYEEAYGDQCESCGRSMDPLRLRNPRSTITGSTPEPRETTHWYLRLSAFEDRLREYLDSHPEWRPTVLNFCRGLLKEGLPERAMTRDLDWGVPVPLDDPDARGKVLYVWFDAPIGYVSFTAKWCERELGDWQRYVEWWKSPECLIYHFIGEDNIIFHALIWPAMLMAEGTYQLPENVVANSFLNIQFPGREEEKISKSRGTAVWIEDYLKQFDPDPLRYYLTAIAPETQRTAFNFEDFVRRNNDELLATLGNFINRTLAFAARYFEGRVPASGSAGVREQEHRRIVRDGAEEVGSLIQQCSFKAALRRAMQIAQEGNLYFDDRKPWVQRKEDPAACATTIHTCIQTVKSLATVFMPFCPFLAEGIGRQLNAPQPLAPWEQLDRPLPEGHRLGEPAPLVRKIDPEVLADS